MKKNRFLKKLMFSTVALTTIPIVAASCKYFDLSFGKGNTFQTGNVDSSQFPKENYAWTLYQTNTPELEVTTNSGKFVPNDYEYTHENPNILAPKVKEVEQPKNYGYKKTAITPAETSHLAEDSKFFAENYDLLNAEDKVYIKTTSNGQRYLEYKDPYTQVLFRDFELSNPQTGKKTFFFGAEGIKAFAHEFKRKVPFGPEIQELKAININGGVDLKQSFYGLYKPYEKQIYINGSNYAKTELNLYEKIAFLLPTLFHEYLHHWASSYVGYSLDFNDEEKKYLYNTYEPQLFDNIKVLYQPKFEGEKDYYALEYWNHNFINNFVKLLNYDFDNKVELNPEIWKGLFGINENEYRKFLHEKFSLADLFYLANIYDQNALKNKSLHDNYYIDARLLFTMSLSELFYYYSTTELIPREYTKYAYESYFNINEKRTNKFPSGKNRILLSSWFGTYRYNPINDLITEFSPSAANLDWSKTFLNGLGNPSRQGNYIQNATVFPNNPFEIQDFKYIDKNGEVKVLEKERAKNRSIEFYQTFLQAMGYGKEIASIYSPKNNEVIVNGYLPDDKYTGIVITDNNKKVIDQAEIKYNPIFNFFGHYDFDEGARMYDQNDLSMTPERQRQINNRLYPKNKYYTYTTAVLKHLSDGNTIHFWIDKNANNKVDEGEIDFNHQITVPSTRFVTNVRDNNDIKKLFLLSYSDESKKNLVFNEI
ncbi:MYPU_1760 family metalloprotease [Mycoplasma hafezii]|uniref:MYPU_1760 family metalloprotease n=1 Tax=Mycoplasma hafezii TaxID=525886 RepID=UPI003CF55233